MIYRDPIPLFEATIFFTKRERGVSWVKVYEYIKERNKKNPANDELDRLFGYLIELESRLEKAIRVDNETVSCLYRELKPDKNDDGDYSDSYLASIMAPDALNMGLMLDEDAYFASLHNNIDSIPMRIAAFLLDNKKPDREYSVSELLELINKSSIEPENKLLLIEAALNPEKYIYMLERTVRPVAAEFRRCDKLTRPFVELYRSKYCNGKITPEEIVRRVWKTPDNITEYNIGPNIMFGDTCLFNRMGQDSTTLNCYMGAVYDFLYRNYNDMYRRWEPDFPKICLGFSNETRCRIFKQLINGPMYAKELLEKMGMPASTASVRLNTLVDTGLVKATIQGLRTYYSVDKEHLKKLIEKLNDIYDELE